MFFLNKSYRRYQFCAFFLDNPVYRILKYMIGRKFWREINRVLKVITRNAPVCYILILLAISILYYRRIYSHFFYQSTNTFRISKIITAMHINIQYHLHYNVSVLYYISILVIHELSCFFIKPKPV